VYGAILYLLSFHVFSLGVFVWTVIVYLFLQCSGSLSVFALFSNFDADVGGVVP